MQLVYRLGLRVFVITLEKENDLIIHGYKLTAGPCSVIMLILSDMSTTKSYIFVPSSAPLFSCQA